MPVKKLKPTTKLKKKPKVLEANGLRIKDMKGKVRALLSATGPEGYVSLNLYGDPNTHLAISAGQNGSGSTGIDLVSDNKWVMSIGVTREGAGITICDQLGRPGFFIYTSPDENSVKLAITHKGKRVWQAE